MDIFRKSENVVPCKNTSTVGWLLFRFNIVQTVVAGVFLPNRTCAYFEIWLQVHFSAYTPRKNILMHANITVMYSTYAGPQQN